MIPDRIEKVRHVVNTILRAQPDEEQRRFGVTHLYGVAQACALLALKRGLDAELGTISGLLHDLWARKSGDPTDHGRRGAVLAREILVDLGCFTESEIAIICEAIAHHSIKEQVHDVYDELLKDADVLDHFFYNVLVDPIEKERARLAALWKELGIE